MNFKFNNNDWIKIFALFCMVAALAFVVMIFATGNIAWIWAVILVWSVRDLWRLPGTIKYFYNKLRGRA